MTTSQAKMPVCGLCQDTGFRIVGDGRGAAARCECWADKLQTYAPGVPLEFQSAGLDNYAELAGNQTAIGKAKAFLSGVRDLYLCGNVGSGKTRLAASIANAWWKAHRSGYFARVPMLLLKLQPQRSDDAQAESAHLLHRLCTDPLVVLDDIGAERDSASDYTRRTLLTIYEERGDRGLRTVWTSNLRISPDPKQASNPHKTPTLGEFMGDDRLASRIAGRADVVWIGTGDQRLQRRRVITGGRE